jgi:hypothetical protein
MMARLTGIKSGRSGREEHLTRIIRKAYGCIPSSSYFFSLLPQVLSLLPLIFLRIHVIQLLVSIYLQYIVLVANREGFRGFLNLCEKVFFY